MKKTFLAFILAVTALLGFAQSNNFEGKIIYDVTDKKGKKSTDTYYFKNDKFKLIPSTPGSVFIYNCGEGWTFSNSTYLGVEYPQYRDIVSAPISKLVYLEEFKTIGGYNCQRVTFSIIPDPSFETKFDAYVTKEIIAYAGCDKLGFTMLEYSMEFSGGLSKIKNKYTLQSLTAEKLSDSLFVPEIPKGATVTDLRAANDVSVHIKDYNIYKGAKLIGAFTVQNLGDNYLYKITNTSGSYVAKLIVPNQAATAKPADKVEIYKAFDVVSTSTPFKVIENTNFDRADQLTEKAIIWLVNNGYL